MAAPKSIDVATARQLLSMGDHPRAESQLDGAVAIHNILQRERVAYLADEVGLGKTYVALGAMALFRHFDPEFRVLVIAPKMNIQRKWANDHQAFVRNNWKINDLRVKGAGGGPARPVVMAERLSDLAFEAMVDDDRDFIARLTSFSFALNMAEEKLIDNIKRAVPWIDTRTLPRRLSAQGRDFVAQAYNAALPRFDLVIIDEAHNLASGILLTSNGEIGGQGLRNATLAGVLGHPDVRPFPEFTETFRPIADRVLMLSATPVESSFRTLWNQVHVVGKHRPPGRPDFEELKSTNDREATEVAKRILIRRINSIEVNGHRLTKNLYRRTWYQGGVSAFDEEMPQGNARQQLTVALVQKKVADVIGAKYNNTFQMGMLASFESFAQTVLREQKDPEDEGDEAPIASNFDNADQADTSDERLGIDVDVINRLLKSHVDQFEIEMAHPKMDELVDALSDSWATGSKALVFVRRIASVLEIKRKIDERYDEWLFARLERDLPHDVWLEINKLKPKYTKDRLSYGRTEADAAGGAGDEGGAGTFFGWFFRGKGPDGLPFESGASLAVKLDRSAGGAATAFAHHRVCAVLECAPTEAFDRTTALVGQSPDWVASEIQRRALRYLPANAGRGHRFDAVQFATLELLSKEVRGPEGRTAERLLQAISPVPQAVPGTTTVDSRVELATETFFTRVRAQPRLSSYFTVSADAELHAQEFADALVRTAARLGNAHIDVYTAFMRAAGLRELPADSTDVAEAAITELLRILEAQCEAGDRSGAFWEFAQLVEHVDLIRSKNLPETLEEGFLLRELPREVANRLGSQRPTVGMHGGVNATAVRQFRMPGYPLIVVCTDVLQEGEDLHLFCDRVIHYGIAWTPSAMEQRTGRVDRLYSLAERRFAAADKAGRDLEGLEKIQVQVPYVPDTVEVLQSRRVFEQMHRFTTLMHQGVAAATKRLEVGAEIAKTNWQPPRVLEPLETGFEVRPSDLDGAALSPAVSPEAVDEWWKRLLDATVAPENVDMFQDCEQNHDLRAIYAWRQLENRVQPFMLRLTSRGSLPLVQAMTPVGQIGEDGLNLAKEYLPNVHGRITLSGGKGREYDMAIEGDVILGAPEADAERIRTLLVRITSEADEMERALTGGDLKLGQVRQTMGRDSREP